MSDPRTELATAVAEVTNTYPEIAERVKNLKVIDPDTLALAGETIAILHKIGKAVESKRQELVEPFNTRLREINGVFKDATDKIDALEKHCKLEVRAYQAEVERMNREAQARIEAEYRQQEAERLKAEAERKAKDEAGLPPLELDAFVLKPPPVPAAPAPTTVRGTVGSIRTVKVWRFEIVDPALVPRDFLEVSDVKVRAAVRAGVREIPGVRIFQEADVRNV